MITVGYIKLHRSTLDWEWYNDIPTKTLFLHLLLTVNIKDDCWRGVTVPRGSRICSIAKLSQETGLSEKQVRGSLEKLERTGSTARQKMPQFSIISIKNWDKFQTEGRAKGNQRAGNGTSKGQQNKNIRNKEECLNTPKRVFKHGEEEQAVSQYADRNDAWD